MVVRVPRHDRMGVQVTVLDLAVAVDVGVQAPPGASAAEASTPAQ
jgi:hypothetical protein